MGGVSANIRMVPLVVSLLCLCGFPLFTQATTFTITNNCSYPVWAAWFKVSGGGGMELKTTGTVSLNAAAGTTSGGRIWPRTNCQFDGSGKGHCETGDCGNVLACQSSGAASATLASFSQNEKEGVDYYDLSVVDAFNVGMDIIPTIAKACYPLRCGALDHNNCPHASHPKNRYKIHTCPIGTNYTIVFCPALINPPNHN